MKSSRRSSMKSILESSGLTVYKKLVRTIGEYSYSFPATGVTKFFNIAKDEGMKIMPKDELALSILDFILSTNSKPFAVNQLLNIRFSDLPFEKRPMYKSGRKTEVAFWCKNGKVYDKVISLIGFDGKTTGNWSDANGEKVTLIDMTEEKEEQK